jgi:hypothetical protein
MQTIATSWLIFGQTLAGLALFGVLYAILTRWMSRGGVEGQTAFMVVGGVTVTVLALIPIFGLVATAMILAAFTASGFPMVVEYVSRVHDSRHADRLKANELAKGLLDDHQATRRQKYL